MVDVDRRTMTKGAAGSIGIAALAGCGEPEGGSEGTDEGGNSGDQDVPNRLQPPSPPTEPENEYWQYLVASIEYQN